MRHYFGLILAALLLVAAVPVMAQEPSEREEDDERVYSGELLHGQQTLKNYFSLEYDVDLYIVSDPRYLDRKISWDDPVLAKTTFDDGKINVRFEDWTDDSFDDVVLEISVEKIAGGDHLIINKISSNTASRDETYLAFTFPSTKTGLVSDFAEHKSYGGNPLTVMVFDDHRKPFTDSEEREYYVRMYDLIPSDEPDMGPGVNESDNETLLPNLYIQSIELSENAATSPLRVVVSNNGQAPSNSAKLKMLCNDGQFGYPDINGPSVNSMDVVTATIKPLDAGEETELLTQSMTFYKAKVCTAMIDVDQQVAEVLETDNLGHWAFHAYTQSETMLPDLSVQFTQYDTPNSQVMLTVANTGDKDAKNFMVKLKYNPSGEADKPSQKWYPIAALKAGDTTSFWIGGLSGMSGGMAFRAEVDTDNLVIESDENNNFAYGYVPSQTVNKPDLQVSFSSFDPDDETVKLKVTNTGKADADTFYVALLGFSAKRGYPSTDMANVNGQDSKGRYEYAQHQVIQGLKQGASSYLVFSAINLAVDWKLSALVDSGNWVEESDENNNMATYSYSSSEPEVPEFPQGDVSLTITPSDNFVQPGNLASFKVTLESSISENCEKNSKSKMQGYQSARCIVPELFKLQVTGLPDGYEASFDKTITVRSGQKESVELTIKVPSDTSEKSVQFRVIAVDVDTGRYAASALARISIESDLIPPEFPGLETVKIALKKGWNLVGLPGSLVRFEEIESDQKLISFVYIKEKGEYMTMKQAQDYLGKRFNEYLANSAFWVYSYTNQKLTVSVNSDGNDPLEVSKGWNLLPVRPDFIGDSLSSVQDGCDLGDVYLWDASKQQWKGINDRYVFNSRDIYSGFVTRSDDSCTFS